MSVEGLFDSTVRCMGSHATVTSACRAMYHDNVGAVAVVDEDKLCRIFTYRDVIDRILLVKREPDDTRLADVMSRDVEALTGDASYGEVLHRMVTKNYTYMPVVDENGLFRGMVSLRGLLEHRIEDLVEELGSVSQYLAVDGVGGD